MSDAAAWFEELWSSLLPIGRGEGGYRRFAWTPEDAAVRDWFTDAASARGLQVQLDRNGNLWAWWLPPGWSGAPRGAFVTGSHVDSVPDGGAFDGPLGVVTSLCAVQQLRADGVRPARPIALVVFADEEGARFGVACAGSRLLVGELAPERARALTDADGVTMDAAMRDAGIDSSALGRDGELLAGIGGYVEVHIEQGRALDRFGAPLGIASGIRPHGRWRLSFGGRADHAGTTRLADRRDPVLPFAATVLAAREAAAALGGLATVGRMQLVPNATNAVAARVDSWLDARAADAETLDAIVSEVTTAAELVAKEHGVAFDCTVESITQKVEFSAAVRSLLHEVVPGAPELPTGAGHDAGVLAAHVPAGMLFVRNPTGVSHSAEEFAERVDCLAGVDALAGVMAAWVTAAGVTG